MNATFEISAVVAVLATVMMITRPSAVHALLYLTVSLLAAALVFFVLGAPFAAALEVIIYAGAIMVLFIFVIMMLNIGEAAAALESAWLKPVSLDRPLGSGPAARDRARLARGEWRPRARPGHRGRHSGARHRTGRPLYARGGDRLLPSAGWPGRGVPSRALGHEGGLER